MEDSSKVLMALEALKQASKDLETNPTVADSDAGCHSPSMKALLELETGSEDLLSGDPNLSTLSHLLSHLKSLVSSIRSHSGGGGGGGKDGGGGLLRLILRRRSEGHEEISRVAGSIGSEIQSWIDRETVDHLIAALRSATPDDDEKIEALAALETRVTRGFDRGLQDVLLRSGVFAAVEAALADGTASKRVRERAAAAMLAMVRFNKAVFVGPVLMGPAIGALISIGTAGTIRVLCGLISSIKSPLIDGLHSDGEIPKLIGMLSSPEVQIRVVAMECCMEIGYFGRKEAIEAMMEEGLIKRLMELQRSELGGALIEMDGREGGEKEGVRVGGVGRRRGAVGEGRPFVSAVARFAIQMEVGEGLRQREKRAVKVDVLRRVKEAAVAEAEAATAIAEVLWGSTP